MWRRPRSARCATLLVALIAAVASPSAAAPTAAPKVAVFPIDNLSGDSVPAESVRAFLIDCLTEASVDVLSDAVLEAFMTRHRVRYAAGIDAPTSELLARETGADSVLVASFEMSSSTIPPKVALIARLIALSESPIVVWADDIGLAGDDAPGFFELGIVHTYPELLDRGLARLAKSLTQYVRTGAMKSDVKRAGKFRPKTLYRSAELELAGRPRVAVVPFVNASDRRNAGDILTLLFMRHLAGMPEVQVVDSGVVRRQLLDARIVMDGGLSLSDAENVAALIDSDYVLGGRVLRYDDQEGTAGSTRVEFSAVLIQRKTRLVVWSVHSYNSGVDGITFFERGTSRTAHRMATQMVRIAAETIARRDRR